jgi:hypothetical protein
MFSTFLIALSRASSAILNENYESEHPCLLKIVKENISTFLTYV